MPIKDKKGTSIVNSVEKILDDSVRKPTKTWTDKGSQFYISSFKKRLKDNDIEMSSIHNEGKSVVAERFTRNFNTKICNCMSYNTKKCVYRQII